MGQDFYMTSAKRCKEAMSVRRQTPKGTLKDIVTLIKCMESGDYAPIYKTNLYNRYSAEYCEYIEVVSQLVFNR